MADSTSISEIQDLAAAAGKSPKRPKPQKTANPPKEPKALRAAKPARAGQSATAIAGQAVCWLATLAIAGGAIVPMERFAEQELATQALMQADTGTVAKALASAWPQTATADYLETLSELALDQPTPDPGSANAAAQRAVKTDPSRAFAWANLAYLEFTKAKAVNQAVLDDLSKSMEGCPLCSQDLIRWRFNFVLSNWNAMPEPIRRKAFEQADLLRWVGANSEFLAEMGAKAKSAGIPYDSYRAAVDTPVRSWDLGPVSVAWLIGEPRP